VDLTDFDRLLTDGGRELLDELAALPTAVDPLTAATRLRTRFPAELVSAALTQDRLRRRAVAKFGGRARSMYFTEAGYEQSTRAGVARLRAERYAAAGVREVADLCCGIGGDALAFAAAGIRVLAVDRDPVTCAVLRANAAALGRVRGRDEHSPRWLRRGLPRPRATRRARPRLRPRRVLAALVVRGRVGLAF
jgi:RNA cap guanine-N2 methyltransferase